MTIEEIYNRAKKIGVEKFELKVITNYKDSDDVIVTSNIKEKLIFNLTDKQVCVVVKD